MSSAKYTLIRIHCNGEIPISISCSSEFNSNNLYANAASLLTHKYPGGDGLWCAGDPNITICKSTFEIWCTDKSRRSIDVFIDEEGLPKGLLPNHRANALITAGRFVSPDYDHVDGSCRNQQLKDAWGSNFIAGDLICVIPEGTPLLDFSVYDGNPLDFILSPRRASSGMIAEHGAKVAKHMMSFGMRQSSPKSMEDVFNPKWERVAYEIIPEKCTSQMYRRLLRSWGLDCV